VRAVDGVGSAAGNIWSVFRTVDAAGKVDRRRDAQIYVVGVDPRDPETSSSVLVAGRTPRRGHEIQVTKDWADEHGVRVGGRLPLSTPSGVVELRVVGIFDFEGGLNLGGYGTGTMPIDAARRIMDKPGIWDEIDVVVADGRSVEEVRARLEASLPDGLRS